MPTGSVTFTAPTVPLARSSAQILLFHYTPAEEDEEEDSWELIPNVRVLGISMHEGADPGAARLRYAFADPYAEPDDPRRFPQVFPLDASGPNVLNNDDRVVVCAVRDDGEYETIFDGFVQVPQLDLGPDTETVTVLAVGTPVREWDRKLPGAVYRDGGDPAGARGRVSLVQTDLPVRFNPDGAPNASAVTTDEDDEETGDAGTAPNTYPVFLGPCAPENKINGAKIRYWTLPMAARYIITQGTTDEDGNVSPYVTYDDLSSLDDVLRAIVSTGDDDGTIDTDDPTTFEYKPIVVQDVDVTGMAWPEALARLVEPHGFGFKFSLQPAEPESEGVPGVPQWTFVVWRKDAVIDLKTLNLQALGATLDPGKTNLQSIGLQRDTHGIANRIVVDAAPIRYESCFVLMPGYQPLLADLATPNNWSKNEAGYTSDPDRYRTYVFDECGEGHFQFSNGLFVSAGTDTGDISGLPWPVVDGGEVFSKRRRPASNSGNLLSVDAQGKPRRAALFFTQAYSYTQMTDPKVWSGNFEIGGKPIWQEVTGGGWRFLDDRLGFTVTEDNPNSWAVGTPAAADAGGVVKLSMVDLNANYLANFALTPKVNPPLFMICCCVDGDDDFNVVAEKRVSSPTQFTIERRIDCRDRFRKDIVCKESWYAEDVDFLENDVASRDDTEDAQALADSERRALEPGVFGGSATIPRFVTGYQIGDKITAIHGRNVSLQTNITGAGESPTYPSVVGLTWDFEEGQSTGLQLSDRRDEPPPRRGKRERG